MRKIINTISNYYMYLKLLIQIFQLFIYILYLLFLQMKDFWKPKNEASPSTSTMTAPNARQKQIENLEKHMKQISLQLTNLCTDIKGLKKQNTQNNYDLYERRYRNIDIPLPKLSNNDPDVSQQLLKKRRKNQISIWVGKVCKDVFSIGFGMLMTNQMEANKIKSYCSENIIRNIINLVQLQNLEIEDVKQINNTLRNKIFPYFRLKYPQTEQEGINFRFSNLLITRNQIQNEEHDLVRRSGVSFDYEESGIYNSQIMRFYNYLFSITKQNIEIKQNGKIITKQLRKCFDKDMENIFKRVYKQYNLLEMNNFDPNTKNNQNIINENKNVASYKIDARDNNIVPILEQILKQFKTQQINVNISKDDELKQPSKNIQNQKTELQYQQKVKSYTNFQIGQKISQSMMQYSSYEIQTGNLSLRNSQLMRVTTKWCEQLWKCFDSKSIVLERQYPMKMKDGSFQYLDWHQSCMLHALLRRQKKQIQIKIKQIEINCYEHQCNFMKQKGSQNANIFGDQAIVGSFSASMFKIYENYLINYLNMLIHGINKVSKKFKQFQMMYRKVKLQNILNKYQAIQNVQQNEFLQAAEKEIQGYIKKYILQEPKDKQIPDLITFKVGDLMRSKCSSKQNEIIALYKQLERISQTQPQKLKIIRIKNRLNNGNKDILMNLVYRQTILVQIQLAIKSDKSKFIENSNKFCHYIYELQRAQFGVIMEMCNIWVTRDKRSKFYLEQLKNKQNNNILTSQKKQECCLSKQKIKIIFLPFKCDLCDFFYYDINGSEKHIFCQQCNKNICFLCQLQQITQQQKIKKIKQSYNIGLTQNQISNVQYLNRIHQKGGVLINLKSNIKRATLFKTIYYNNEYYLFDYNQFQNNGKIKLIHKFKQTDLSSQFLKQNIIFSSQKIQQIIQINYEDRKLIQQYFIPNYSKNCHKNQKTSLFLRNKKIKSDQIFDLKQIKNWVHVEKLDLQNNQLQKINILPFKFSNISTLNLSKNKIKQLSGQLSKWKNLRHLNLQQNNLEDIRIVVVIQSLAELNISRNKIKNTPSQISKLKNLQYCNLGHNKIQTIPVQLCQLDMLRTLFLEYNYITDIPQNISNLESLQQLNLRYNKIIYLPSSIGKLNNLKKLNLNGNYLTVLTQQICNLSNLKQIYIAFNNLIDLSQQIGNLKQLQIFDVYSNNIKKIPISIGQLRDLKEFDIARNKLQQLPQCIFQLHSLEILRMHDNKIPQLSDMICKMKNLKQVQTDCKIPKDLLLSFGEFHELQIIYYTQNTTHRKTIEYKQQKRLQNYMKSQYITLQDCNLIQLPQSIKQFKQLNQLNLMNNKLQTLPNFIANLKTLTKLNISGNNLIQLPQCIFQLSNLMHLYVWNNQLQKISYKIANLRDLTTLDLCKNNLKDLPQQIKYLQYLEIFHFCCNKITKHPKITNKNVTIYDIQQFDDSVLNCEGKHGLKFCHSTEDRDKYINQKGQTIISYYKDFQCDRCRQNLQKSQQSFSCRQCNNDYCMECIAKYITQKQIIMKNYWNIKF